ncbi:MAG: NrsF family protein [Asticcacaulis sp.]
MTDALIERLTAELKPVRPLRTWPMWLAAIAALAAVSVFVIVVCKARPEMAALLHGVWPGNLMAIGKPLLFLVVGLSAFAAMPALMRPEGGLQPRPLLPAAFMVLLMLAGLLVQVVMEPPAKVMASLIGGNLLCFSIIFGGGAVGFILLWAVWLRRSASPSPRSLAALAGLGTGAIAAAAYAIHCNMDAPIYLLSVYGFAVVAFAGVASLIGGRLLRW